MKKFLKIIITFAIVGALIYIYSGQLHNLFKQVEVAYFPCQNPITYKIESFDTQFGISRKYFLSALSDAEAIWEKPIDRELFAYDPLGNLKINLIYDYRQQATTKLKALGITVDDDKASYDNLKKKYEAFKATHIADQAAFKAKIADYEARQKAYEQEVANWNKRHGAPKDVYDRLNADRIALNAEGVELSQLQAHLNEEVDDINAVAVVLNRLAVSLNLNVAKYNTVGGTLGGEFEEGNYQSGADGQQINIYEFDSRTKLVRVLAHELGHAFGLEHVDDPTAIMYRLNNGINGALTATDLSDLKKFCGIK